MAARILLLAMFLLAADAGAAAIASGRHWRISIESLDCQDALITIGMRIRYRGPGGPVEAPVSHLVDGQGKQYLPRSLVWKSGSKALAQWLASGALANVHSASIGEIELKFEVAGASGGLELEFGDIRPIRLTSATRGICESVLKPDRIRAPRVPARAVKSKLDFPVYRARYPCLPRSRTLAAEYPPYLPRQLLLFGRGYLPNARQVELPMGRAPAQSYSYVGPDNLNAVEDAARRALAADFPQYGTRHFAFNWGVQKSASGNEAYSIGIYDLRACPAAK